MTLKLFNTLTREKEEFKPITEGEVKFYSCGQTIYDDLHIGNARAYVAWDTLTRYLRWKGYNVRHVQNITDVGHLTDDGDQGEDKVEKRAKEMGLEPMELVEDQIERYFEDTKALNIKRQDIVPRATGHINEMIEYVQKIIDNGYAYEVDGNLYFDVEKFAEDYPYGEMANKDIEQLKDEAESRVEEDEKKKNQYDFALWLNSEGSGHLMEWTAKFEINSEIVESTGYPGWHLECSVMGQKYLGDEFDIHAGGKDHIFPHHPNERAQCFAATGEGQARYWLHNEFIQVEGEKMSKSEGNFYTVRELLNEYSGDAIRLHLVSSHYRSETSFSHEGLEKAEKELGKARRMVQKVGVPETDNTEEEIKEQFEEFMDDDLNTAKAKQYLMETVSDLNSVREDDEEVSPAAANTVIQLFQILGVDITPNTSESEAEMADLLMEIRDEAREEEDWETSDYIRDQLQNLGFEVEDTDEGSKWLK
ncbi:cysteine--tRNA ligase [Candidatus Nanohalobium constans]|uniref:Cysteine--tRNA ligase n=1 Tax=Candidatus Nanohalobium constans TaxID=2565781 RepID=A0A5Q0UFD0_9ARCH|nr:cysteine--tRNA ligase [Candidatus Nanohalobium constans]QGA80312.1 cysteinyl-tRNA synthetase [Candidatus Nanohalobium constans]